MQADMSMPDESVEESIMKSGSDTRKISKPVVVQKKMLNKAGTAVIEPNPVFTVTREEKKTTGLYKSETFGTAVN